MPQHVNVNRKRQPSGFAAPLNHAPDAHAPDAHTPKGMAALIHERIAGFDAFRGVGPP